MTSARQRPRFERLCMALVALLFLLQPLAGAAGSCTLRAKLFGRSCCCAQGAAPATKSCCEKRAPHEAPAPKKCGCELSAPPLVPPGGATELPNFLAGLERAREFPCVACRTLELVHTPPRAHAPPGRASCFHTLIGAGLSRALAFERTLRC